MAIPLRRARAAANGCAAWRMKLWAQDWAPSPRSSMATRPTRLEDASPRPGASPKSCAPGWRFQRRLVLTKHWLLIDKQVFDHPIAQSLDQFLPACGLRFALEHVLVGALQHRFHRLARLVQ